MTDREAMIALAAPEPEPFKQVTPHTQDTVVWQRWHDLRLEALAHVKAAA